MEVISITENQRDELCKELAKLTFDWSKINGVECIYVTPYINFGMIKGNVFEVTVVKTGTSNIIEKFKEECQLKNQEKEREESPGFKIIFHTIDMKDKSMELQVSEFMEEDIDDETIVSMFIENLSFARSIILYERCKQYTKLQKQAIEFAEKNSQDSWVEVIPPLEETFNDELELKQLERESEVVKEFTHSDMFQYIKKM